MASSELCSWKEIASYLGVSVKTAQLWERDRGLPVHRPAGPGGQVRAFAAELDAWRTRASARPETPAVLAVESTAAAETEPGAEPAVLTPSARVPRSLMRFVWLAAIPLVIGVILLVSFVHRRSAIPADYRFESHAFVVFDARGQELWHREFRSRLEPQQGPGGTPAARTAQFRDLDGDGVPEVLFVQQPVDAFDPDRALWCFTARGELRWRFQTRRRLRTQDKEFTPLFRVLQVAVGPIVRGGPTKVIVASIQVPWWATQIAVLDQNGHLEREYWHSGALYTLELGDANNDGKAELYAGGINNARKQATLIVLDPERMQGASKEGDAAFQLLDQLPPVETARLFFPRTCTSTEQPYTAVRQLAVVDGHIIAEVWEHPYGPNAPSVFYTLSPSLQTVDVAVSDRFRVVHEQLQAAKAITHALTKAEINGIRPTVVSHGGEARPPGTKP
ncbi:MAG: helix-turn-helix domain-containing protein [Bryobacterales bacterium]|nr:helix-turn-helix domain-containing protein [Bryobacterales bacterium]